MKTFYFLLVVPATAIFLSACSGGSDPQPSSAVEPVSQSAQSLLTASGQSSVRPGIERAASAAVVVAPNAIARAARRAPSH
jgi:hypothetical protein